MTKIRHTIEPERMDIYANEILSCSSTDPDFVCAPYLNMIAMATMIEMRTQSDQLSEAAALGAALSLQLIYRHPALLPRLVHALEDITADPELLEVFDGVLSRIEAARPLP